MVTPQGTLQFVLILRLKKRGWDFIGWRESQSLGRSYRLGMLIFLLFHPLSLCLSIALKMSPTNTDVSNSRAGSIVGLRAA